MLTSLLTMSIRYSRVFAGFKFEEYQEPFYDNRDPQVGEETIDIWWLLKDESEASGIWKKILDFLGINPDMMAAGAVGFIQWLVNILLGIAALIALAYMIYGFVRVFFADGEEAVGEARTIVKNSAIALGIIALAWFIETFFFFIYNQIANAL